MTATPEIVIYSTGWCPYCERARALLARKGLAFREVKIDENPAERDAMLARTGGRRTVPQIFVGDHHVGGYDDLYALEKAGKLDALVAGA
ncbi:MAG: glutaredoxin 3 [Lysobacterales bacterium]|jgi:glutaredoxin 3|nr:MAG: glutaredoxin 3 [Xanthomonadales bacterium]